MILIYDQDRYIRFRTHIIGIVRHESIYTPSSYGLEGKLATSIGEGQL